MRLIHHHRALLEACEKCGSWGPHQLRQIVYETTKIGKDVDVMLAEAKEPQPKPYVIWEVYAGMGRITQKVSELKKQALNVKAEKFILATGWDFSQEK